MLRVLYTVIIISSLRSNKTNRHAVYEQSALAFAYVMGMDWGQGDVSCKSQ